MPLPTTGPLSLSAVNTELGRPATATISLGEAAVRALAGVPSGPIGKASLRGKSAQFSHTISEHQLHLNLRSYLLGQGWDARAAADLPASVVLPELDGRSAAVRNAQSSTIVSVIEALDQRSQTLGEAAAQVLEMEPPQETAYNPISSADAVIKYAGNFVPSWAGAIAIDLLPGILVFVLAVTQAAIRTGRDGLSIEETLTLADLRAAINAMKDVEATMGDADTDIMRRLRNDAAQGAAEPPNAG